MEITKSGNIKIEITPDRYYQAQFVGYEYYRLVDVKRAFPFIADFTAIKEEGNDDLGLGNRNGDMIRHHCTPYLRVGYIVE